MLELARYYGQGSVSIDRIADMQHISKRYLEHIFARLREAGIVLGTRGSKGGYVLQRAPGEVTVGEVVRAVEGPLGPVHCVDDPGSCAKVGHCATHDLWAEAAETLNELLDSRTIEELLRYRKSSTPPTGRKRGRKLPSGLTPRPEPKSRSPRRVRRNVPNGESQCGRMRGL